MLGNGLPGHKNKGFHKDILSRDGHFQKELRVFTTLSAPILKQGKQGGMIYQKTFPYSFVTKKKPLTLLIFCRLVVGSAASVL